MAYVFNPGLQVAERATVRKVRRLPLPGEVLVNRGDVVKADTTVARAELPGKVLPLNLASQLACSPAEIVRYLVVKEGDKISKGRTLAATRGLFGFFKNEITSPIDGFVESISKVTGQVMLREHPELVNLDAYVSGIVDDVKPGEGVTIRTKATFIQGIFGLGGEVKGEIRVLVDAAGEVLSANHIDSTCRGKIIVGGAGTDFEAYRRALEMGVPGIITGGFPYGAIRQILGHDLGVAVTGTENIGTTLIVTEGFGRLPMSRHTFELLVKNVSQMASMNGATQIRAGVQRPEVIIPLPLETDVPGEVREQRTGIQAGSRVRAIRHPYFGRLGRVAALPESPVAMSSEITVRVLRLRFDNGEEALLPRANVEVIDEG